MSRTILLSLFCLFFALSSLNSQININYSNNGVNVDFDVQRSLNSDISPLNTYFDSTSNSHKIHFKYAAPDKHILKISDSGENINPETTFLGNRRGVMIFNSVFEINNSSDIKIELQYEVKNISEGSSEFYDDLINAKHALNFKQHSASSDKNDKLLSADWFDQNKDYLLIETDKDAPAIVSFSDILAVMPDLAGKSSGSLHLLHKGTKYPIYIDDNDGKISADDRLIFLGKRAHGDTTWYDFYTKDEPFYLYYDASEVSERLELKQLPTSADTDIDVVEMSNFYQIHEQYYDGHSYNTDKVEKEGWMSLFFHPLNGKNFFSKNIYIDPSDNVNDKINIKFEYLAVNKVFNDPTDRLYKYEYLINGKQYATDSFEGLKFGTFDFETDRSQLITGANQFKLVSLPVELESRSGFSSAISVEVSGRQKPYALSGVIDFSAGSSSNSSRVSIPGFSNNKIILISDDNTISFANAEKKSVAKASAVFQEKGAVLSTLINGSVFSANSKGMLVTYLNAGKIIEKSFDDITKEENADYIANIPANSLVAVALAFDGNLNEALRFELSKLGAQNIPNSGTWSFAGVKGGTVNETSDPRLSRVSASIDYNSDHYVAQLNLPAGKKRYVAADLNSSDKPGLTKISDVLPSQIEGNYDAVVLTRTEFLNEAADYKTYRESNTDLKIKVIDVRDIYKEYNYGKVSPFAIKDFLRHAYNNWTSPELKYVVILGDASWDPGKLLEYSISTNFVPVYGFPYSDYWYGLIDDDYEFELLVGRIPINNSEEYEAYMDKVRTYDTHPVQPWMKDFLLLSGGSDGFERHWFKDFSLGLSDEFIISKNFVGDTVVIAKEDTNTGSEVKGGAIRSEINKGKAWTTFLGHAAADIYDLEGWQAERLNNENRYGILTTLSCNTGDFANPQLKMPRNEAYVMEPKKGYVISTGSTTSGFVEPHSTLVENMFKSLTDTSMNYRRIIDMLYYGKSRLAVQSYYLYTRMHYSLLGDPLLSVRIAKEPDPFVISEDVEIIPENSTRVTDEDDSVEIIAKVHNNGTVLNENLDVKVIRTYASITDTLSLTLFKLKNTDSLKFEFDVKDKPGTHRIEIALDPQEKITDADRNNNIVAFELIVLTRSLSALEPLPYWNVNPDDVNFRVIDQLRDEEGGGDKEYKFILADTNNLASGIYQSSPDEISVLETHIEWEPDILLESGKSLWFGAYYNSDDNSQSEILWVPFHTLRQNIKDVTSWGIKSVQEFASANVENLELINQDENIRLQIKNKDEDVDIISFSGNENTHSYISIDVDDKTYVDGFWYRGFNVVTVPVQNNGENGKLRRFDTWGDETTNFGDLTKDSVAIDLVNFLRDSVSADEYLIVGTCNYVWRMPILHKLDTANPTQGSLDTLKSAFELFGSELINDVTGPLNKYTADWKHAFGMIGRKGLAKGEAHEKLNDDLDSVTINSTITRYSSSGTITTTKFGPADHWRTINIDGYIPEDGFEMIIKIFGIDKTGLPQLLDTYTNNLTVSVADISAEEYPYLYAEIEFKRLSYDLELTATENVPYISSVECDFDPAAELAALKSSIKISEKSVLRGNDLDFSIDITNISRRTIAEGTKVLFRLAMPNFVDEIIELPSIAPDEVYTLEKSINTSSMVGKINVTLVIDPDKELNELYYFNNSASSEFEVYQDTIPPTIELQVDGEDVEKGDFVSIRPNLNIKVRDNSNLPITKPENLIVYINSRYTDEKVAALYDLKTYTDQGDLKMELDLVPGEDLEYGNDPYLPANSFKIVAIDATGNSDTLRVLVNVSLQTFFEDLLNAPNPFSEETKIEYNLTAPDNTAEAIIDIYDMTGRLVDTIRMSATIGNNSVLWNTRSSDGNSLSAGIYFYRVTLDGFFAEPVYGKMIIIN